MEEIDENSLEWAKRFKKKLRFDVGQLVFLKSDIKKKCPMVVSSFLIASDDYDYCCTWMTTQKERKTDCFVDKILVDGN
jgi:hypothetical protein